MSIIHDLLSWVYSSGLLLVGMLSLMVGVLVCVAYLVYMERKVIAFMQMRHGPSVVGPLGLLQPFSDALKLLTKECIIPFKSRGIAFFIAPVITFALALAGWAVIPLGASEVTHDGVVEVIPHVVANLNLGLLYILAISSLEVYGVIIAGWASGSNYAFLGAIRSVSQMISYEMSMGLVMLTVSLATGSLKIGEIVTARHAMPYWMDILILPMALVFFISILAETNRHPFDLPEAESELVSGYNVEYSSMSFAMFFLGEYANMILVSAMMVILFLGGWYPPIDIGVLYKIPGFIWFFLKVFFLLFCFIWVRATIPRYRYDQLMRLGWKVLLPFSFVWVMLVSGILLYFDALPGMSN
ncbi:NADH-quinone oxidoreductase subunit NuoH [Anaplasma bovis]|uniref:NADH-quinone oxidoreductase subunit NuoH n=1 Tax=Anaplasma bovis TaxID=186733 RepID=UPI002FF2F4EF